jgi:hypothetical protein
MGGKWQEESVVVQFEIHRAGAVVGSVGNCGHETVQRESAQNRRPRRREWA